MRERVEQAIEALGYVRNETARQLRAGASRTIAVIVLDLGNPFFADVVAGVEEAAEVSDALVIICNSASDPTRERRHLAHMEEQRVMGVLLSPVGDGANPVADQLQARGTPVVLVDSVAPTSTFSSVAVDDQWGGRLVGEHLLEGGHRRIAFVGGPLVLGQVRDRLAGLRAAVGAAAVVEVLETEDMSLRAGSRTAAALCAGRTDPARRPTAVFCANDLLALGMLGECLRQGLRVPQDLALVGYDDISFAASAPVPLTSVRQPREELGRTAVELLLERVNAGRRGVAPARRVQFDPALIVRESSLRPDARVAR